MALCAMFAFRPIGAGYDFWAHAAVGRWIVEQGRPPETGLFLWGSEPTPWIAHSWGCQAFFYLLLTLGGGWTPIGNASVGTGPLVVVLFTTLVACAVFALLWRLWKRCSDVPIAFWTPLIFAVAIWSSAPRFQPRQEMLSALFLAVLLSFLVERRSEKTSSTRTKTQTTTRKEGVVAFIAFVLLFALWVNLHALVALGLVFLWTAAVCDAIQDRFDARAKWLLALALCCSLATLVNPYGWNYWAAAEQLKAGNMAQNIEEWMPPIKTPGLWRYIFTEMTLCALALGAWIFNPQRRWSHAIWVVLMSYLFLNQRRHLWILALVALAVLAANANFFDSERAWRWWRKITRQEVDGNTTSTRCVAPNAVAPNAVAPNDTSSLQSDTQSANANRLKSVISTAAQRSGEILPLPDERRENASTSLGEDATSTRSTRSAIPVPMRFIAQGGAVLCLALWTIDSWPTAMNRTGVSQRVPERTAFALEQGQKRNQLPRGYLFNDYAWSSYLQWRLNGATQTQRPLSKRGATPIYIDLLNAYPDGKRGLLQEYFLMLEGSPKSMALMKRRGVNLILLPPEFRKNKNVGLFRALLRNTREWRIVSNDEMQGTLWVRRALVALPARSVIFDGVPERK